MCIAPESTVRAETQSPQRTFTEDGSTITARYRMSVSAQQMSGFPTTGWCRVTFLMLKHPHSGRRASLRASRGAGGGGGEVRCAPTADLGL